MNKKKKERRWEFGGRQGSKTETPPSTMYVRLCSEASWRQDTCPASHRKRLPTKQASRVNTNISWLWVRNPHVVCMFAWCFKNFTISPSSAAPATWSSPYQFCLLAESSHDIQGDKEVRRVLWHSVATLKHVLIFLSVLELWKTCVYLFYFDKIF